MKKIKFFLTMVESSGWVGRRRVRNGRIVGRRSEGKGGVKVYEAYEVKRRKITLSFTSPGKDFFLFMMSLLHREMTLLAPLVEESPTGKLEGN